MFVDQTINFSEAVKYCKSFRNGSKLAVPRNGAENQCINQTKPSKTTNWIGIRSHEVNPSFKWISVDDNQTIMYTNWSQDQPSRPGHLTQLCVAMWYHLSSNTRGSKWDNVHCSANLSIVCQRPVQVINDLPPSTSVLPTPVTTSVQTTGAPTTQPSYLPDSNLTGSSTGSSSSSSETPSNSVHSDVGGPNVSQKPPLNTGSSTSSSGDFTFIAIGAAMTVLALVVIIVVLALECRRRKRKDTGANGNGSAPQRPCLYVNTEPLAEPVSQDSCDHVSAEPVSRDGCDHVSGSISGVNKPGQQLSATGQTCAGPYPDQVAFAELSDAISHDSQPCHSGVNLQEARHGDGRREDVSVDARQTPENDANCSIGCSTGGAEARAEGDVTLPDGMTAIEAHGFLFLSPKHSNVTGEGPNATASMFSSVYPTAQQSKRSKLGLTTRGSETLPATPTVYTNMNVASDFASSSLCSSVA
eukprot:scpid57613/ scgid0910/ 